VDVLSGCPGCPTNNVLGCPGSPAGSPLSMKSTSRCRRPRRGRTHNWPQVVDVVHSSRSGVPRHHSGGPWSVRDEQIIVCRIVKNPGFGNFNILHLMVIHGFLTDFKQFKAFKQLIPACVPVKFNMKKGTGACSEDSCANSWCFILNSNTNKCLT
jgi:hypothetical protein